MLDASMVDVALAVIVCGTVLVALAVDAWVVVGWLRQQFVVGLDGEIGGISHRRSSSGHDGRRCGARRQSSERTDQSGNDGAAMALPSCRQQFLTSHFILAHAAPFDSPDTLLARADGVIDLPIAEFLETHFSDRQYSELRQAIKRMVEGYDAADPDRASTFALRDEWMGHGNTGSAVGAAKTGCGDSVDRGSRQRMSPRIPAGSKFLGPHGG